MSILAVFGVIDAAGRAVGALRRGKSPFATTRVIELRRGTCERCQYFNPKIRLCRECMCMVDFKSQLATEACPRGYWSRTRLTMFSLATLFKLNARRLFRR